MIDPRAMAMRDMYLSGKTLADIGDAYGLTHERVRQLLRPLGITRKSSPRAKMAAERRELAEQDKAAKRDVRASRTYGCGYDEARRLNAGMAFTDPGSVAFAYIHTRQNARRDRQPFGLTLPEFCGLFEAAGGLMNRGLYADGLVLARVDKSRGFVLSNVRVKSLSANSADTRAQYLSRRP